MSDRRRLQQREHRELDPRMPVVMVISQQLASPEFRILTEEAAMVARSGVRFTADEIWETPDDGNRYEVIDGELYVTPPPIWEHQLIVSNLLFLVRQYIG